MIADDLKRDGLAVHLKQLMFWCSDLKRIIPIILVAIILLSSCKKDDDPIPPVQEEIVSDSCTPIPPWSGQGLRPTFIDSAYFTNPIVNPNNSDEIVFLNRRDHKVYKLNYRTGEKNLVLQEGMSFSWADWSVKDWILFTRFQNLYKVKSNGDSLTQITSNGVGWRGSWDREGKRYLYTTLLPSGQAATVISDYFDSIIDTLPIGLNIDTEWISGDTIFFNARMYIIGDTTVIEFMETFPGGGEVAAISNHEFILLSNGLRRVNVLTGDIQLLHDIYPNCNSYLWLDYSQQKQKLLTQGIYREIMPDGIHQYIRYDIIWLNLDGTVHEVIDIAQFMNE